MVKFTDIQAIHINVFILQGVVEISGGFKIKIAATLMNNFVYDFYFINTNKWYHYEKHN